MYIRSKLVQSRAGVVAGLLLFASVAAAQQEVAPAASAPGDSAEAERQWFPTPSILPVGGKLAVVSGNPFESGTFTLEFVMPDGYTLPPHTNPSNEHVLVKSGALMVGVGRRIDRKKSVTLSASDTASAPAGVPHWSIAQGETHLIITEAMGPYRIAYMNVRDEPGSHAFPSGYQQ